MLLHGFRLNIDGKGTVISFKGKIMEVKVLLKSLMILEMVSIRGSVLPGELYEELSLPRSTCIRLLNDLTAAGYLELLSKKRGYRLGPLAYKLCNGHVYMPDLTLPAKEIMDEMCQSYRISMQLSVRHGDFRVVLCGVNGGSNVLLNCETPRHYDLLKSISGRMLLANAPKNERHQLVEELLPKTEGPFDGKSVEEVERSLDEIVSSGKMDVVHDGRVAICVPIKRLSTVVAVIGCVWHQASETEKMHSRIMDALHLAAHRLSSSISPM